MVWGLLTPGHQTCRNKARTKETLLATVGLAGACVGNSTEVMLAVLLSLLSVKAGPGVGADPRSSVRTRFQGDARLTDLNHSQSFLDAGTAVD